MTSFAICSDAEVIHYARHKARSVMTQSALLCRGEVPCWQRDICTSLQSYKTGGDMALRAICTGNHVITWLVSWGCTLKCLSVTSAASVDNPLVTECSLQPIRGFVATIA